MATAYASTAYMTARTFDAPAVNAICNHPLVLPGLSLGAESIDVTDLLADRRNLAFMGAHGGAVFHWTGPRIYAAHDFFLPEGRGRWALAASREMLSRVFAEYGARMVWAETPVENRACRMFNRWLGFKSLGVALVPPLPGSAPIELETFIMEAPSCR